MKGDEEKVLFGCGMGLVFVFLFSVKLFFGAQSLFFFLMIFLLLRNKIKIILEILG